MGRLVLLVATALLFVSGCLGATWEFGTDRKNSKVIATSSGEITFLEKTKRVQFSVPPCTDVVYVKVVVENEFTTPSVTYDKDTYTVTIHYKLLQSSYSRYNVVAKGVPKRSCSGQVDKRKSKRKHKKMRRPTASDEDYSSEEDRRWRKRVPKQKYTDANDVVLGYQMLPGSNSAPYYY